MAIPVPTRSTPHRSLRTVAAFLLVTAAAVVPVFGSQVVASSSATAASVIDGIRSELGGGDTLGEADGVVPDGTTVFDDAVPAVANLDPALLRALRRAATDAAGRGVTFVIDSGWRSPAYQAELFREAVAKYGSPEKAAEWVAPAGASAHESGEAVDVGTAAAAWLSRNGARDGLCQIYRNEPWHFELRPTAAHAGCPPPYADAADDPRTQTGR